MRVENLMAEGAVTNRRRRARAMTPSRPCSLFFLLAATLTSIGLVVARFIDSSEGQAIPRSSNDLAKAIIERAKSSETVDLTLLGDKTCFVAEQLSPLSYAKDWFPGYEINDDQLEDKSHGVWHMIVANNKEHVVRIYSIRQSILRWDLPEETKIRDAVGCKSTVKVIIRGPLSTIIVF
jgi:hypothetical protein